MEKTLRNFAMAGVPVKRFTYLRNGQLIQSKPKKGEIYVITEDYLGDRSLIWIACIFDNRELWRHSINDVIRITYEEPVA